MDMLKLVDMCIYYLIEELDLPLILSSVILFELDQGSKTHSHLFFYNNMTFNWVQEARYLEIFVISGKKFSCNYRSARQKFFRAFNSIYEKSRQ